MTDYGTLLRTVIGRQHIDAEAMAFAIGSIMDGTWTNAQAGAFLGALATKGETAKELTGAASAMRERSLHVEHELPVVVDTCGTGGDGAGTINVSTCAGFVLAGCGLHVAKHGNRAASSKCGSADVLEAVGVPIDAGPDVARADLEQKRFAFLFAQRYHPAMRVVAPIRRELAVRTVFNLLGPLTNPARATHQVIGVANLGHLELVGEALQGLGAREGAVIHATSGIDEIAGDVPTHVFEFSNGSGRRYLIEPSEFGISATRETLAGGEVATNAAALRSILTGEDSARARIVALNAALVLLVANQAASLQDAFESACRALSSGAAYAVFESLLPKTETESV